MSRDFTAATATIHGSENTKTGKLQERVTEMMKYLTEQEGVITEYSEVLVRRLIERITVYDDQILVGFKSGIETTVNV